MGNAAGPLSQPPRQIGPTSLCKTLSAKTATGDPSSGGILLSTWSRHRFYRLARRLPGAADVDVAVAAGVAQLGGAESEAPRVPEPALAQDLQVLPRDVQLGVQPELWPANEQRCPQSRCALLCYM